MIPLPSCLSLESAVDSLYPFGIERHRSGVVMILWFRHGAMDMWIDIKVNICVIIEEMD